MSYDRCVGYGLITALGFACVVFFNPLGCCLLFYVLVTDCLQVFLFSICMTPNTVEIQREDFSLVWLLKRLHMKGKN